MSKDLDLETYLYISNNNLCISVYTELNKKVFEKKMEISQKNEDLILKDLSFFLNENILSIEQQFRNFINKIFIILDLNVFFPIEISLKKNSFNQIIKFKNLNHLLYDAKDYCKKTIDNRKILHMFINKYILDNKIYAFLPEDINVEKLSLEIKFICIENNFVKSLENILRKYQISIYQLVSANYVKNFLSEKEDDLCIMAKQLKNGYNLNEITLVNKTFKNQGFFEKFFNFFN